MSDRRRLVSGVRQRVPHHRRRDECARPGQHDRRGRLLANPNTLSSEVRVHFLKPGVTVARSYTLAPTSRLNIWTSHDVPEIGEGVFNVEIEVLNFVPIAVEKAMYWNSEGSVWAAGTDVTATRLPRP